MCITYICIYVLFWETLREDCYCSYLLFGEKRITMNKSIWQMFIQYLTVFF